MPNAKAPNFSVGLEIAAIDNATAPIRQISASISNATSKISNFTNTISNDKGIRALQVQLKGLAKVTDDTFSQMSKIAKNFFWLIGGFGLSTGLLGKFSFDQLNKFSSDMIDFKIAAKGFGMSASKLEQLSFAGKANGIDPDLMRAALKGISEKRIQAATRSLDPNDLLFQLPQGGFHFFDNKGALKSTTQSFFEVLDKIRAIPSEESRVYATEQILKSPKFLPLVNQGSAATKAQMTEAQPFQISELYSEESQNAYLAWQKSSEKISLILKNLKFQFLHELLPPFTTGLDALANEFSKNFKPIKSIIKEFGQNFESEIGSAVSWTVKLGETLMGLQNTFGIVNTLGFLVIGSSIVSLCKLLADLWKLTLLVKGAFVAFTQTRIAGFFANLLIAVAPFIATFWPVILVLTAMAAAFLMVTKHGERLKNWLSSWTDRKTQMTSDLADRYSQMYIPKSKKDESASSKANNNTSENNPLDLESIVRRTYEKPKLINNTGSESKAAKSEVTIRLENTPPGSRVVNLTGDAQTSISLGYSMAGVFN